MLNSKYSKVLSVVLVIAILIIIGFLVFIGIDWYKASISESENKNILEQFNNYVENEQKDNNNENLENVINNEDPNNEIIDPVVDPSSNVEEPSDGDNNNSGLTIKRMKVAGTIEIPKTNVKYAILDNSSAKAMEVGIAMLYGPGVNKVGNTVLAGHNYRNGTFFSNNKKLNEGDVIYLTDTSGKRVKYVIYKKYQTDSNDFSYATRTTNGKREISVSTCTDDSSARLLLWAKEG